MTSSTPADQTTTSVSESPEGTTTGSIITTQADITSEVRTNTASQTISMTTVEHLTTDQPMTTTSEGTISTTDATIQKNQPTTSESGEASSIT